MIRQDYLQLERTEVETLHEDTVVRCCQASRRMDDQWTSEWEYCTVGFSAAASTNIKPYVLYDLRKRFVRRTTQDIINFNSGNAL